MNSLRGLMVVLLMANFSLAQTINGVPNQTATSASINGVANQAVATNTLNGVPNQSVSIGTKTTVFTDNIPYSNGDLVAVSSGNWTYGLSTLGFSVLSNNVEIGTGTLPATAIWSGTGGTAATKQWTAITRVSSSGDSEFGPGVRVSGSSGYGADCYGGGCKIVKLQSGSQIDLTSFGSAISSPVAIELDASGTSTVTLSLYIGGTLYQTGTDSTGPLTTGTWGIVAFYNSLPTDYATQIKGGNL